MPNLDTIAAELREKAEAMENDQRLVTEFCVKYDRSDIKEAVDLINWEEVFSKYSDKTLNRMNESGTNLAFSVPIRRRMYATMLREISNRNTTPVPESNGMEVDGSQK
jgi:hypothetical protein